jgi:hypothetical protein
MLAVTPFINFLPHKSHTCTTRGDDIFEPSELAFKELLKLLWLQEFSSLGVNDFLKRYR